MTNGHEIRAHKIVLVSGSTVWRKLLTSNDQLSKIPIPDLEQDVIEALVTFIYSGSVPEPPKRTDQLLIAADKYGVDGLRRWCELDLINTITMNSAIRLFVLSHRCNASILYERSLNFIRLHIAELKERDEWNPMFHSYPELALKLFNFII